MLLAQVTMSELTSRAPQPVEREALADDSPASGRAAGDGGAAAEEGARGKKKKKKEDKYGLMDNIVIESLPPMREEGPRVFIIS